MDYQISESVLYNATASETIDCIPKSCCESFLKQFCERCKTQLDAGQMKMMQHFLKKDLRKRRFAPINVMAGDSVSFTFTLTLHDLGDSLVFSSEGPGGSDFSGLLCAECSSQIEGVDYLCNACRYAKLLA